MIRSEGSRRRPVRTPPNKAAADAVGEPTPGSAMVKGLTREAIPPLASHKQPDTASRFYPTSQEHPMPDRFDACLPHILHHEGGWADHPADPGGATMKGITLAVFREWTGKQSTKAELRAISDETVAAIYRKNFWFPSHCDKLPAGVDLIVFDLAVNSGPGRARRFLQEAVGAEPDGVIGAKTLAAVAALPPREVILRLRNRREKFYRSLNTFGTFGKGWMRRLSEVAVAADRMAK